MKAIEQYFPVVLLVMLYKVNSTFKSTNKILTPYHAVQSDATFEVCG